MSEGVASVAGIDNVGAMRGVDRASLEQEVDTQAFLGMFEKGIDRLAQRPELNSELDGMKAMTDVYAGPVGAEKVTMMGGAEARAEQADGESGASVEDRLQSLYFELTNYQVAWRIVQNMQRDLSQVLRGS